MRCGGVRRGGEFLYACLHLMMPCGGKMNVLVCTVWPGIVLMSFLYILLELIDIHLWCSFSAGTTVSQVKLICKCM